MARRLNGSYHAAHLAGLAFALAAWAGAADVGLPAENLVDFDISAQPLAQALNRYGETAPIAALYPSDLPMGLYSAPVHGRYSPACCKVNRALLRTFCGRQGDRFRSELGLRTAEGKQPRQHLEVLCDARL